MSGYGEGYIRAVHVLEVSTIMVRSIKSSEPFSMLCGTRLYVAMMERKTGDERGAHMCSDGGRIDKTG